MEIKKEKKPKIKKPIVVSGNSGVMPLSTKLQQKITIANRLWGKTGKAILDVYHQALSDGWTPLESGDICRDKLIIFSSATIRGILPPEAKHPEKIRIKAIPQKQKSETEIGTETNPEFAPNLAQSEYKQIQEFEPDKTVTKVTRSEQEQEQEQPEPETKPETQRERLIRDYEKRCSVQNKIDWNNPETSVKSIKSGELTFTLEEYPIILEYAVRRYWGKLNESKSSREDSIKAWDELNRIRALHKICLLCDKKAVSESIRHSKTKKYPYCAKHWSEIVKLNQRMGPITSKLFANAAAHILNEKKEK